MRRKTLCLVLSVVLDGEVEQLKTELASVNCHLSYFKTIFGVETSFVSANLWCAILFLFFFILCNSCFGVFSGFFFLC